MDYRELIHMFEIRYTDGMRMMTCDCTPDILPGVLQQLMDEGNRIEQVKSKWM